MNDVNLLTNNGVNVSKSLELFGDMEMYDSTLRDFLQLVDAKLANLKRYRETADLQNYANEVHSLKSDASYLGFTALADLSYQFELKAKANDIMYIYNNYQTLLNEAKRIIKISKQYLGMVTTEDIMEDMTSVVKDEAILVIDDSNLVANFIKKIFDNKYDVYIANDGAKAIEIINGGNADRIKCCLLDLNMPNVNGFEVLDYFQKNNLFYKMPVSIITGNDTADSVKNVFNYPIVDLLTKPFNERDIRRIIEKTLNYYK